MRLVYMRTPKKTQPIYYKYPIIAHIPDRGFIQNLLHKLLYLHNLVSLEQLSYTYLEISSTLGKLLSLKLPSFKANHHALFNNRNKLVSIVQFYSYYSSEIVSDKILFELECPLVTVRRHTCSYFDFFLNHFL